MNGQFIKTRGTTGTAPVFMTAIFSILAAIMGLRFGHAVGNVGLVGILAIFSSAMVTAGPGTFDAHNRTLN